MKSYLRIKRKQGSFNTLNVLKKVNWSERNSYRSNQNLSFSTANINKGMNSSMTSNESGGFADRGLKENNSNHNQMVSNSSYPDNIVMKRVNDPESKNSSNNSSSGSGGTELLLKSFTSLLSSAQITKPNGTAQALPQLSSDKNGPILVRFLSGAVSNRHGSDNKRTSDNTDMVDAPSADNDTCCTFPSLLLKNQVSSSAYGNGMSREEVAALNLAIPFHANKRTIESAPNTLLENVTSSFKELFNARLKSSCMALLRQTMKLGAGKEARTLEKLLIAELGDKKEGGGPISVTAIVTSFRVSSSQPPSRSNDGNRSILVLPLIFEVIVDAKALGKMITLPFQAPGTISGTFEKSDGLLSHVEVAIDTIALLKVMMLQARTLVKKAINRAATIAATVNTVNNNNLKHSFSSSLFSSSSLSSILESSSNSNISKSSSTSNRRINKSLLTSYPQHLRETVKHFLPSVDGPSSSTYGFPPQLAKTLKSLSGGLLRSDNENSSNDSASEEDNGKSEEISSQNFTGHDDAQNACNTATVGDNTKHGDDTNDSNSKTTSKPLHHELFSWLQNDDMILKEEPSTEQQNYANDLNASTGHSNNMVPMPTPLSSLGWETLTELAAAQQSARQQQEQKQHQPLQAFLSQSGMDMIARSPAVAALTSNTSNNFYSNFLSTDNGGNDENVNNIDNNANGSNICVNNSFLTGLAEAANDGRPPLKRARRSESKVSFSLPNDK